MAPNVRSWAGLALLLPPCGIWAAAAKDHCSVGQCAQQGEQGQLAAALNMEADENVHLLQMAARQRQQQDLVCEVGAFQKCPGSDAYCQGDQCCPGIPETQGKSFPCPSASMGFTGGCQEAVKVHNCVPCLCSFDVDRTLTSSQGHPNCTDSKEFIGVNDTAYGGGNLTLSPIGQSIKGTFCQGCHVAIVTAGDASGFESAERAMLEKRLKAGRGRRLTPGLWAGPSYMGENRTNCSTVEEWNGTFAVGCADGTKQHAVQGILAYLAKEKGVTIAPQRVWHFDDRSGNIEAFEGTGYNAREVSCNSRDLGGKGLCGAEPFEIVSEAGIYLCPEPEEDPLAMGDDDDDDDDAEPTQDASDATR